MAMITYHASGLPKTLRPIPQLIVYTYWDQGVSGHQNVSDRGGCFHTLPNHWSGHTRRPRSRYHQPATHSWWQDKQLDLPLSMMNLYSPCPFTIRRVSTVQLDGWLVRSLKVRPKEFLSFFDPKYFQIFPNASPVEAPPFPFPVGPSRDAIDASAAVTLLSFVWYTLWSFWRCRASRGKKLYAGCCSEGLCLGNRLHQGFAFAGPMSNDTQRIRL